MILAAFLLVGAAVPTASAPLPLSERVPDVATRFCVDLLSRAVPVPAVGADEDRVLARYGLTAGLPKAAIGALGTAGIPLIARARLASGEASDGSFAVALGGAAGETCRVMVYRAPLDGLFVQGSYSQMKTPARGWKSLPAPAQPPGALRLSFVKRDAAGRPFLANLIAPVITGPVAMVVNVAAVPPNVTLPQGY